MAAFVWTAAVAGNWSVGANWSVAGVPQSAPPTSADAVAIGTGTGATQSNCTLDVTGNCLTITFSGYSGTFDYTGQTLNVTGTSFAMNSSTTIVGNNSSAVVVSGTTGTFSGGARTFPGTVSLTGAGVATINSINSFFNLTRTGTALKTDSFSLAAAQTVTGTLTVTGNSTVNRMFMNSTAMGTNRTVTCTNAPTLSNVDFQDITAAGAGGTWAGTSMGDAQGNSNITFNTPATQTRTGAGGNWSTAGNWTSRVPLPQDDVVIGAGASGTITGDMPRGGKSLDWTGFTGIWSNAITVIYYGNLTLGSGMTITNSTATLGGRSSQTITSNGKTLGQTLTINGPGGTYTLQDALSVGAASNFTVTAGTFTTNNFNVTAGGVSLSSGSITNMGSSTFSIISTNALTFGANPGATVNAGTSTVAFTGISSSTRTFGGGGKTYNILTYTVAGSTGELDITGSNTFNTINFSDASNARTLAFTAATTTTITNAFNVSGTAGKLMTITSITAATHTLSKPTGTVSDNFLSISNSIATGGASWFAGANSTNGGGNTGWIFAAPPNTQSDFLPFFR